ncbi:MAG: Smr/MutS family protein [Deltaproteobacteria bacterium]|nr:Smr/MutS family protein [Deltaproteobacteria bacterium]
MNNHLYQTLEFDKVLDDLSSRACSSLAAERLRGLRPLPSREVVLQSLGRTTELRTYMDSGESFPIEAFNDVGVYLELAAVEGSYLQPDAFCLIHKVLDLAQRISLFFTKNQTDFSLLKEVGKSLAPNPPLAQEISKSVDLKSKEIRDQASSNLAGIRRQMARARERLQRDLENLLERLWRAGVLQERLITMRQGRWVLPVKENHRHRVKGVLHDRSASGATHFVEPLETLELNNRIRSLEADERHEIEKILRGLTDLVRVNRADLEQNLEILISLDCIHAMALTSKTLNQCEPALNTQGLLKIKGGRHPLLALREETQSSVIPLDISIGQGFKTLVITGPNAGGKTVALKTLGLLALMVSCGLHVPADGDSQIPIFNRIFAHVGDAQSIEMDLSTFSAHLKGIKGIVDEAAPLDLVLIDEIGTGTDPQEGAALAMAVLEVLTSRGVMTVVTTHQGTLKAFAHETPGIANGSMAFDSKTLSPTYGFRPDIPGSSYAFEIAKRMGLRDTRSASMMDGQARRLEDLILRLQNQVEQNERLEEGLKSKGILLEGLTRQYQKENDRFKREEKRLRRKAAEEASEIIKESKSAVEKAIKTIREKEASRQSIHEAKVLIREAEEKTKKAFEATTPDQEYRQEDQITGQVRTGDRVFWTRGGVAATVLSDENKTGYIVISSGSLRVRVPRGELLPPKDTGKVSPELHSQVAIPYPENVGTEIDVRGMQVDEALEAVDKYVNDALLAGLREVRIVHGVGTGALRSSIIPFLKQHPLVEAALPGGPHQKNLGATVVKIAGR